MIKINIDKAKTIAHDKRRTARSAEFAPHDEIIAKRIPGTAEAQAEAARQAIREKYAVIQDEIDSASDVDSLMEIVSSLQ
jgi:Fe-S cluster assembly ATPase SufC